MPLGERIHEIETAKNRVRNKSGYPTSIRAAAPYRSPRKTWLMRASPRFAASTSHDPTWPS